MDKLQVVITYIKLYYVLYYHRGKIVICDQYENNRIDKDHQVIPITRDSEFVWGKAIEVTGLNLWAKDNQMMAQKIIEKFRHPKTLDFFKYVRDYTNSKVIIKLSEISEEFPALYE